MDVKTMSRVGKHLQGWQAGALVVAAAILAALIAVPRPVLLDAIPLPRVDRRMIASTSEADRARAASIDQQRPSYDIRALGEAIRAYGIADAAGDTQAGVLRERVARAVPAALQSGAEAVVGLRAYQMQIFLDEIGRFARTGEESEELRELGGGVVPMLRRAGWATPKGHGVSLITDRYVLEILFRKRWNELTGLQAPPFALTLDEQRALHAFLLAHPVVSLASEDPLSRCRAADEYRLRKVAELAAIDKEYPGELARGILLTRLNRPKQAVDALTAFVEKHPDGGYTLRARNALRMAHAQLHEAIDE